MKNIKDLSQHFLWGFDGTGVTPEIRRLIRDYPPAGFILFKRNIEDLKQVKELARELRSLSRTPLLIGIDEEGGRVRRLPAPFVQYPPAATWGSLYEGRKNKKLLFEAGFHLAHELLSLGINVDFAPVLDVNSNPKNPVIGDRAFSSHPRMAGEAATAFFLGMKKAGLIACGKHFPGHGDTEADSHLTLPTVNRSKEILKKVELAPFRMAIRQGIPMLMTAHVVYRALDPENPATLSSKILRDLLRKKMKFKGIIISDDLEMKAISEKFSLAEASLRSLQAGVDLLLIGRGGEKGREVVESLQSLLGSS